MKEQTVEKYRTPVRILHWVHAVSFTVLFLTGLVLFIPALSFLAEDGWTRLVHRGAAVVFVIAPLFYLIMDPKSVGRGIKQAFSWGKEDLGWLRSAPRYYFSGADEGMPPQGAMNTGQKWWWLMTLVFGLLFVITGGMMWFAREAVSPLLMQWMVLLHDISFMATGTMFFVHIYLVVFHPKMTGSWDAMACGRISIEYARKHHGKWFSEIAGK